MQYDVLLLIVWTIGVFLTLGVCLKKGQTNGMEPGWGDVIAAVVWPAFWLVVLGFINTDKES